jgi:hypothetical protein
MRPIVKNFQGLISNFDIASSQRAQRSRVARRMADICVYYFSIVDRATGKVRNSKQRATLEAISTRGDPVLESRLVVDSSEVDTDGLLTSRQDVNSYIDAIRCEIKTLMLRARSRELEAARLGESDTERWNVLCAEIVELMTRANRLHELTHADRESVERTVKNARLTVVASACSRMT